MEVFMDFVIGGICTGLLTGERFGRLTGLQVGG